MQSLYSCPFPLLADSLGPWQQISFDCMVSTRPKKTIEYLWPVETIEIPSLNDHCWVQYHHCMVYCPKYVSKWIIMTGTPTRLLKINCHMAIYHLIRLPTIFYPLYNNTIIGSISQHPWSVLTIKISCAIKPHCIPIMYIYISLFGGFLKWGHPQIVQVIRPSCWKSHFLMV